VVELVEVLRQVTLLQVVELVVIENLQEQHQVVIQFLH